MILPIEPPRKKVVFAINGLVINNCEARRGLGLVGFFISKGRGVVDRHIVELEKRKRREEKK